MTTRLIGAVAAALLLALGCAHRPAAPADALGVWAAAVERRDWSTAYALMSDAFRKRVSLDAFRRQMEASAAELSADARALRAAAGDLAGRIEIPRGEERIPLVREGGTWRLDAQPLEPYGQSTPRAALRAFLRAVENRRYDVLLRLVPARYRGEVTAERLRAFWEGPDRVRHRALLGELRLAQDSRIVEEGEEALLTYGGNRQVRFVREEGEWRIESPE